MLSVSRASASACFLLPPLMAFDKLSCSILFRLSFLTTEAKAYVSFKEKIEFALTRKAAESHRQWTEHHPVVLRAVVAEASWRITEHRPRN